MATVLQGRTAEEGDVIGDGGPAFAEVFVIVWLGSMVVTLNTKLLGGHISFFQSVCVLGNIKGTKYLLNDLFPTKIFSSQISPYGWP